MTLEGNDRKGALGKAREAGAPSGSGVDLVGGEKEGEEDDIKLAE